MTCVFKFEWRGSLYAYSRGEYYVNGKPTGENTFKRARDSLAHGPRSAESLKIAEQKKNEKGT